MRNGRMGFGNLTLPCDVFVCSQVKILGNETGDGKMQKAFIKLRICVSWRALMKT